MNKKSKLAKQREIEDSELIIIVIGGFLILWGVYELLGVGINYFMIGIMLVGLSMIINRFILKRQINKK